MLWKMDLKRAFTLLFVDPEFVQRLAFELTNELTMLYITGMFGYTGMPGAFQVITRVLKNLFRLQVKGSKDMYVDDTMGVCRKGDSAEVLATLRAIIVKLLGPDAVEDS